MLDVGRRKFLYFRRELANRRNIGNGASAGWHGYPRSGLSNADKKLMITGGEVTHCFCMIGIAAMNFIGPDSFTVPVNPHFSKSRPCIHWSICFSLWISIAFEVRNEIANLFSVDRTRERQLNLLITYTVLGMYFRLTGQKWRWRIRRINGYVSVKQYWACFSCRDVFAQGFLSNNIKMGQK